MHTTITLILNIDEITDKININQITFEKLTFT
jgi:hypothetical protein